MFNPEKEDITNVVREDLERDYEDLWGLLEDTLRVLKDVRRGLFDWVAIEDAIGRPEVNR